MHHTSNSLLLALLALLPAAPLGGAEVRLKPRLHTARPLVLLGDLADITADPPELAARLERLALFPSPARGRTRVVRQTEIRELLSLNAFDRTDVTILGAWAVRITSQRASAPPTERDEEDDASQSVLVATRSLPRGHILRSADVQLRSTASEDVTESRRLKWAIIQAGSAHVIRDPRRAVGMELTRPLAAGQPLDGRALRRPVLIERGAVVRVVARSAGVRVATDARATDDGAYGDLIVFQTLDRRERFPARVVGPKQAELYASGVVVSGPPSGPAPPRQATIRERTELRR